MTRWQTVAKTSAIPPERVGFTLPHEHTGLQLWHVPNRWDYFELTPDELREGAAILERKVRRWKPSFVAVVGVTSYRIAFRRPRARVGPQEETIAGARVWVLPNPSGRTAAYQLPQLIEAFSELRASLD